MGLSTEGDLLTVGANSRSKAASRREFSAKARLLTGRLFSVFEPGLPQVRPYQSRKPDRFPAPSIPLHLGSGIGSGRITP